MAELQAQLELQLRLRDMQSAANEALKFLDSVEEQLKHAQTTVKNLNKEPDKQLLTALEDYVKQVEALQNRLGRSTEGLGLPGRAQIADKLGGLFRALDGSNGAPTPYQRQYFTELEPEFRARMQEVNRFITDTLPQWNEKLREFNAPTLTTRKSFEF